MLPLFLNNSVVFFVAPVKKDAKVMDLTDRQMDAR
jgi:hypothetical protein